MIKMKLYMASASPFVRKVRLAVRALGLSDQVVEIATKVAPITINDDVNAANPLGKIPTLVTDEGDSIFDSAVICAYLNDLAGGKLIPDGADKWRVLRLEAVCDGILDAAILCRYELALRPEGLRWDDWLEGQAGKIKRGLGALEAACPRLTDAGDLATLATACVLAYLDFRFPERDWRSDFPQLATWFAGYAQTSDMLATPPE